MHLRKLIPLFILLILILSACNSRASEPSLEENVQQMLIPTPGEDTAVVYGKLTSEATGKAPQANVFLSRNITAGQDEVPAMLSFSFETNPRAQIDEAGNFFFSDVPAGIYAITLWTPPNDTFFIPDEDGQDYLWVVVDAGDSLDLGEIQAP